MAKRKRYLFVCNNSRPDGAPKGSCAARGAVDLHRALKERLKEACLHDLGVRACTSSCLDACWAGPVIAVEPDHYFYGRVRLEDVEEIVQAFSQNHIVQRLVLTPDDFIEPKALRRRGLATLTPHK